MNQIPHTAMRVSPVTLGTMTYGSPVPFERAVELTRYAVSRGINHIDTANMYEGYRRVAGSTGGVAEEIVGEALRALPRDQVIVSTKAGMKVGSSPEDEGTSAAAIHTQLDRSLRRMGLDYVDLFYLHRPDESVRPEEMLRALQEELDGGRIRGYGVSNYSAPQLRGLLGAADRLALPRPVVCQPPLSLLRQEALDELLPLCAREEIAVIPYQIYQGGLLTGKYRRGSAPPEGSRASEKPGWMMEMDDALYTRLEEVEARAAAEGVAMAQYALRWVLRQSGVVSAIVGVKNERQIDDALAAL